MGQRSIKSIRSAGETAILALGGNGRVAQLLRAAWSISPDTSVKWQSRSPKSAIPDLCFDPLESPDRLVQAISKDGVVFALSGATPASTTGLQTNVTLAECVIRAATAANARHLFLISSAAVYGTMPGPLSEQTELQPVSEYGQAKVDMENTAIALADQLPITILRIGNVLGADQLIGARNQPEPRQLHEFPDHGSPLRSYIGPVTLAAVLSRLFELAQSEVGLPQILNVATPVPVEMADLLDAASVPWTPVPAPAEAIPSVWLDVAMLSELYTFADTASDPAQMIAELKAVGRLQL